MPIQERDAAGIATETWWPFAFRVSTRGRRYGESLVLGGPSSLTTYFWLLVYLSFLDFLVFLFLFRASFFYLRCATYCARLGREKEMG